MLLTRFRIGWPHRKHCGDGAGDAECLGVRGGVGSEGMPIDFVVIVVFQCLFGCEIGLAVTNGIELVQGGELVKEGLLHLRGWSANLASSSAT